jgi:hypothetical protein
MDTTKTEGSNLRNVDVGVRNHFNWLLDLNLQQFLILNLTSLSIVKKSLYFSC